MRVGEKSALLGKKPIVSVTYENERISIQNSLPYIKCVLRLSCVVHGPIYGRFMGFIVTGFPLYKPLHRGTIERKPFTVPPKKTAINRPVDHTGARDVKHICKGKLFCIKILSFS